MLIQFIFFKKKPVLFLGWVVKTPETTLVGLPLRVCLPPVQNAHPKGLRTDIAGVRSP